MYTIQHVERHDKSEKESIHSGQFMVSHFEAEEQDDEDNVAVPIPEVTDSKTTIVPVKQFSQKILDCVTSKVAQQQLEIDTSLSKLFQCMSLAYRQKLTSPKWNRFRGIRLRWKDKIRLNNVIWRCWHLQFIKKENTLICQFASPLDVDTHNKPEAVVLEGKYWKRKLAACTAEYKKWRMFYRHNSLGNAAKECTDTFSESDLLAWDSSSSDNMHMMVDEDYMGLMSDTLFSTIANQPFVFPDSREIAKAGLAEFIQPSLGPLQPNLDDYMDTLDPLQEFITGKLPTVPEEQNADQMYKFSWGFLETEPDTGVQVSTSVPNSSEIVPSYGQYSQMTIEKPVVPIQDTRQAIILSNYSELQPVEQYMQHQVQPPSYHSSVISKNAKSQSSKIMSTSQNKLSQSMPQAQGLYGKNMDNIYTNYQTQSQQSMQGVSDRIQVPLPEAQQAPQQQEFKLPQATSSSHDPRQNQAYKFTTLTTPNMKFTSQVRHQMPQHTLLPSHSQYNSSHTVSLKEDKPEPRRRGAPRGRQRSRSNTREPIKRPPLISAVSDPALLPPPSGNVLLTQLLTNTQNYRIIGRDTPLFRASTLNASSHDSIQIKEESSAVAILPQPPTTLVIPAQITSTSVTDPLLLNTFSNSNSPVLDSSAQNLHSPTSSQGSIGSPNRETSHKDRRVGHIHAEQKRRYNIKNGFDMIHSLIPHLNQNPNTKLSKAAMLQKGAEYIRQLRSERNVLKEEMDGLRHQIETLNSSISNCQSMLPATGAPVSRRRDDKMQEMFDDYVKNRTTVNWKFWIFSLIFRPLLTSFNNFVSTSSLDDLYSTTMHWIEQHCTLVDLRPIVLNSLRYMCTKTDILSEPEKLADEARQMVFTNQNPQNS